MEDVIYINVHVIIQHWLSMYVNYSSRYSSDQYIYLISIKSGLLSPFFNCHTLMLKAFIFSRSFDRPMSNVSLSLSFPSFSLPFPSLLHSQVIPSPFVCPFLLAESSPSYQAQTDVSQYVRNQILIAKRKDELRLWLGTTGKICMVQTFRMDTVQRWIPKEKLNETSTTLE